MVLVPRSKMRQYAAKLLRNGSQGPEKAIFDARTSIKQKQKPHRHGMFTIRSSTAIKTREITITQRYFSNWLYVWAPIDICQNLLKKAAITIQANTSDKFSSNQNFLSQWLLQTYTIRSLTTKGCLQFSSTSATVSPVRQISHPRTGSPILLLCSAHLRKHRACTLPASPMQSQGRLTTGRSSVEYYRQIRQEKVLKTANESSIFGELGINIIEILSMQ